MAEIICDSKAFTVELDFLLPDITIIDYSSPEKKKKGEEVQVSVTIENTGGDCKYKVKLIDSEGSDQIGFNNAAGYVIDEEPNTYLIGDTIRTGELKTVEVNTNWGIKPCAMPNNAWKLKVEAWRKT